MGKAFEALRGLKTIREKEATIEGIDMLFIEPPKGEHEIAKQKYLRWEQEIKGDAKKAKKDGRASESTLRIDSQNSKMSDYNRALVMMTAHEPETRERLFPDNDAFNAIFGTINGETKNGDVLFSQLLECAQEVSTPYSKEEAEKN